MKRLILFLLLLCLANRGADADPPFAVAPLGSKQAKDLQKAWADHHGVPVQFTNSIGMKLNLIPPGEFMMGSPERKVGHQDDETQHLVKISKPFYLSVYEVTQQQYEQVMNNNPSKSKNTTKLVAIASWNNAVTFCQKLSEQEGMKYHLPTEAEWEYACHAGTTTIYSFGDDATELPQYAWYYENSTSSTHPVGELKPNPWGLHDMHGNVWEWCQDWYAAYGSAKVVSDPKGPAQGVRRVLRGGAFFTGPAYIRTADRHSDLPVPFHNGGFRVARIYHLSP
jgi:formylglycine-generating enzyme required for sulfatase activity